MRKIKLLLVYAADEKNATFSYQHTWPEAFLKHQGFECRALNLLNKNKLTSKVVFLLERVWRNSDAVVLLHSVFSNSRLLSPVDIDLIRRIKQAKVFFIGNEYKLMPEKMRFCEDLGLELLVTQSHAKAVHELYRKRLGCQVAYMPNTGFDPEFFKPVKAYEERPIDIGYRSLRSPLYLGHDERQLIADCFSEHCKQQKLKCDISLEAEDRLSVDEWAVFLNECKAQIGTEAGGDYFELDDRTRLRFIDYLKAHPEVTIDETKELFFKDYENPVPMRIISGRNVEAAATGTLQILFEGEYGGFLQPDVHYIALKKDFSNIDEVLRKFRDNDYCKQLIANARELALSNFTYDRLLERFRRILNESLRI